MNVLEQLQALGFREEPYRFDTGGGTFDGYAGVDGAAAAADAGLDIGDTGVTGAVGKLGSIGDAVTALANELATSPGQAHSLAVNALQDLGFGRLEGFNVNNPTQSIDELVASSNFQAVVPLALSFMPGFGLARGLQTGAQLIADLSSGKLSPQDALADLGLTLASAITGQSKGTLAAAARGDFGTAAMSAAKGAITSALAQHTGAPASIVGAGVNAVFSGIGSGAGKAGAPGGGGTDVAGGPADMAPGGTDTASLGGDASPSFDLGNLGPLFTVAALEDILTPKEKDEQEQEQARSTLVSPFGSMPYA